MNQVRVLHEASQLAIRGKRVLVSCPSIPQGRVLAEQLQGAVAVVYLGYAYPCEVNHEPTGCGWAVRFRSHGEVFFTPWFSSEDHYFDYYFSLRPVEEICRELKDQGLLSAEVVYYSEAEVRDVIPLRWESAVSLIRKDVCVLNRYERIQSRKLNGTLIPKT